ncbi:MAG: hypothetical protein IKA56_05225 [Clostridia bacterium]|nr:hypothetical protein [Clostridia bacterium]
MEWPIIFIVSLICLIFSVILAIFRAKSQYKSGRIIDSSKILFAGVAFSSILLFLPVCVNTFRQSGCGIFETVLISIHSMIRLFIVDGDFDFITSNLGGAPKWVAQGYITLFSILFVMAPILTFGFVLSFFQNLSAYKRYFTHYNSNVFIFSELNERSLALAESLYKNNSKDRLFIFTDVFKKEEEQSYELIEKAKELGAVCFKKDIVAIDFSFHSKKSELNFFAIGDDQTENLSQALKIVENLKYRDNTKLYVFSTQIESEMLLANAFNSNDDDDIKIKVRRVNEVQSLIMRNLYDNGFEKFFESAYDDNTGVKKINAVIIGMGQHGTEMIKALSWACQMDGYLAEINSFDLLPNAKEKFTSECPELMAFSGKLDIAGEAKYTINIHPGIDVGDATFDELLQTLPKTTYAFVALGNDEKNIATSVKLRTLFERMGHKPEIQSVVYNSDKKEALKGITNFKGQAYDIDFIGDMRSSYSEEVILGSDVEEEALKRHMKWGRESDFWRYNYNYKSSIASAVHKKMKILCGMPGIEKDPKDRTEEELWNLRILEHNRWNAYMRSEGYVYGGTVEKEGRNDLAKMHNCLVPFAELPLKEQEKDDD